MSQISQSTQKLIARYREWHQSIQPGKESNTIHVDEVASRVAGFYEKIRGVIDWREEHLLKRGAIERGLKRRFISEIDLASGKLKGELTAEPFVLELIRSGHFPNDKIEEIKINKVQEIIDKYIFIFNNAPLNPQKSKIQLSNWLCSIAACEIEETLSSSLRETTLINYMFGLMKERIRLNEKKIKISEEEKNIQIYIAVQRALFKMDAPIISYYLLKYYYPWENLLEDQKKEIAQKIYQLKRKLDRTLSHPLGDKFYHICEKYDTPYLLLGDIISENPAEEKIEKPEILESLIKKAYSKRLKTLKSRLTRAAVYSTLSIFLSKIILLMAIEIPLTKIFTGNFNFFSMGINVFVPTFLMFFLVITVKPPKKGNLEKVIMETMKIAYDKKIEDIYEIKIYRKKSGPVNIIINFLYFSFFFLLIGFLAWVLHGAHLSIISYIIFIIFISLIAFAGTKIRQRSRELDITESRYSIVIDSFAMPVVHLGNWLTNRWRKYNVIAIFFAAIIDMPFLMFVEFIEQWGYFLKEKKEKIH